MHEAIKRFMLLSLGRAVAWRCVRLLLVFPTNLTQRGYKWKVLEEKPQMMYENERNQARITKGARDLDN